MDRWLEIDPPGALRFLGSAAFLGQIPRVGARRWGCGIRAEKWAKTSSMEWGTMQIWAKARRAWLQNAGNVPTAWKQEWLAASGGTAEK